MEANDFPALHEYEITYPEHFQVESSDGLKFNAYMIKPPDFDATKKYPVLVYDSLSLFLTIYDIYITVIKLISSNLHFLITI